MPNDTIRESLKSVIEAEYAPLLEERIEQARQEHQYRVEAALDKALVVITGKPAAKAKPARKPRKDKGSTRLKRGLPDKAHVPAIAEAPEIACATCEHYLSLHENGMGECGVNGCGCGALVLLDEEA